MCLRCGVEAGCPRELGPISGAIDSGLSALWETRGGIVNFADLRFWQLLAAGLGAILTLRVAVSILRRDALENYDRVTLCALSLFLLLSVSWITFLIFAAVGVGSYVCLSWILRRERTHHFKYLLVLIPLQLLPLCYYKYADFACNQVFGWDYDSLRHLIIPAGISFYTFQKIAFVIDTLSARQPLPRFLDYCNFASFFPQIVAGPIERRRDLLPQMEKFRFRWMVADINAGAEWIALGLFFKCCLADNLAGYFDRQSTDNPFSIGLANVVFGLRIYFDFAGYSLVAVGLARCVGVTLTLNFTSPAGECWRIMGCPSPISASARGWGPGFWCSFPATICDRVTR